MKEDGFLGDNQNELKELAQSVGASDSDKIAGAAAALATRVLAGSSIAKVQRQVASIRHRLPVGLRCAPRTRCAQG
ncbi:MAG: hypothetical protein RLZZ450_743 [Pseudomonadota bacterium]|jgi:hypothetical protein